MCVYIRAMGFGLVLVFFVFFNNNGSIAVSKKRKKDNLQYDPGMPAILE